MKYIFILDQGHRKDTSGKNANGLYEYEFNQDVANKAKKLLEPYGEVYFTMTTKNHPYNERTSEGRTKNLQYRCDIANNIYKNAIKKYGKDNVKCVFVSIHANAFSNPSASGYEIYVYKKSLESYKIAQSIHNSAKDILKVGTSIKDRGIKEANFYVLKHTSMNSLLIEHEFYTNPEAVKKLKDINFRQKCAEHTVKGLCNYYGIEYKEPQNKDNKDNQTGTTNNTDELYKVQVGAFSDKENAEELLDKLDEMGFKGFINKTGIEKKEDKKEEVKENKVETPIAKGDDNLKLEYKGLVKKGSRGNNVKELQEILNKLGYNCGKADGIAGNNTITQIKQLQRNNGLASDGMAGQATYDKINELLNGKVDNKSIDNQSTDKNKYYKFKNAHVIEVKPLDLYIDTVKKVNKNIKGDFINGSLFSMKTLKSVSTLVNNGQVVAEQLPHDNVKRGTFVVWKDGTVSVEMIDFISKYSKLKDIKFAIGGFNIMPKNKNMKQQLKSEWFDYNTVGYRTWRSMLGYSKKKNKVLVVIVPNTNADEGQALMKKLGCDCAISLDSGGSTSGRFNGKTIRTTARRIHNIVRW